MLYDINGTEIENAYDINGTSKDTLYDIEGNAIELVKPTTFSILGDSYSTFTGDFLPKNLTTGQSYWTWYDGTKNGVTDKSMTWYRLFESATGWKFPCFFLVQGNQMKVFQVLRAEALCQAFKITHGGRPLNLECL